MPGAADGTSCSFAPDLVRGGCVWVFPAGDTPRVGVAIYDGERRGPTASSDRFQDRRGHAASPDQGAKNSLV